MGRTCSPYGGRGKVHRGFLWGDLSEEETLNDPGVDERIKLKWIIEKWDKEASSGFIWLRVGRGGGCL
jgi:hypothetical protein